jgi:hypothetical protein
MQLRDHPLMSYHCSKNWPPVWTRARGNVVKTVAGEVGVLSYVHSNDGLASRCYLVMDHEGETYVGTLLFDDHAFCEQMINLLRLCVNRSIKDIGDLDLSHMF